jgi:hypothetical protein
MPFYVFGTSPYIKRNDMSDITEVSTSILKPRVKRVCQFAIGSDGVLDVGAPRQHLTDPEVVLLLQLVSPPAVDAGEEYNRVEAIHHRFVLPAAPREAMQRRLERTGQLVLCVGLCPFV